jgi:signal peptide peptidase SppA
VLRRGATGAFFVLIAGRLYYNLSSGWAALQDYVNLPPHFVVELDLERQQLVDRASSLAAVRAALLGAPEPLEVRDVRAALRAARADDRVAGVMTVLGGRDAFSGGLAQLQELRSALLEFRAEARRHWERRRGERGPAAAAAAAAADGGPVPLVAFAQDYGEGGQNGTLQYLLASAHDRVYVAPGGLVSLLGFSSTQVFVRPLLDRWGVVPIVFRREAYKTALAAATDAGFTPEHRANLTSLLGDLQRQVVEAVAASRAGAIAAAAAAAAAASPAAPAAPTRDPEGAVRAALAEAPLPAARAAELGLVDGALTRDGVEALLLARVDAARRRRRRRAGAGQGGAAEASAEDEDGKEDDGDDADEPRRAAARLARLTLDNAVASVSDTAPPAAAGASSAAPPASAAAAPSPYGRRFGAPRVSLRRYLDATRYHQRGGLMGLLSPPDAAATAAAAAAAAAAPAAQKGPSAAPMPPPQQPPPPSSVGSVNPPAPFLPGSYTPTGAPRLPLPAVVVVYATGPILQAAPPGGGPPSPLDDGSSPGGAERTVEAARLTRLLRALREHPDVRAVVLRISSPGGSASASAAIHREVELLRASGKPVVASMGEVAASGGYYVAAPCTEILAEPGTITGSIGVLAARVDARRLLADQGANAETVAAGENAAWASPLAEMTPSQAARAEAGVEATYRQFLGVVSRGRGMTVEAVRAVAGGRVFTGREAASRGLVDALGGLERAVERARELAGLPPEPAAAAPQELRQQKGGPRSMTLEWPPRRRPPALLLLRALQGRGGGGGGGGAGGGGAGGPTDDGNDDFASMLAAADSPGLLAGAAREAWRAAARRGATALALRACGVGRDELTTTGPPATQGDAVAPSPEAAVSGVLAAAARASPALAAASAALGLMLRAEGPVLLSLDAAAAADAARGL